MRNLRTDNLKLTNDVARLSEKNNEARRKLDIAESSEASMKTQLKSAEAAVRGLRDEVTRTKALVAQVRATCATDVRRRDRQIDTLKRQLGEAGRARGSRTNPAITTINVTGDYGAETSTRGSSIKADGYSLRSETNAFLAKLAQDLSEENESMLNAMRQTMAQLRQMSGYNSDVSNDGHATRQPSWDDMAAELDAVLEHMKTILTNPSFVPIEEVVVREEEIDRLKDGWVKMENRWKEAVHLIDSWRKRMAASGKPVNEEELQMSLRLSPVRAAHPQQRKQIRGISLAAVAEEDMEAIEPVEASPCPSETPSSPAEQSAKMAAGTENSNSGRTIEARDGHASYEDYHMEEPNFEILQESTTAPEQLSSRGSSPFPEPPQLSPLRNSPSAANRRPFRDEKPREKHGDFTTIVEESTGDLVEDAAPRSTRTIARPRLPSGNSLDEALLSPAKPTAYDESESETENQAPEEMDSSEDELAASRPQKTPRRGGSKLPLPRNVDATTAQSPLTMANIAAKLAASEREADAARVRAKLKAFRGAKRPTVTQAPGPEPVPEDDELVEDVDPVKQDPVEHTAKPEKRKRDKRTSKAASRRRSTLSPWELNSLISGDVQS